MASPANTALLLQAAWVRQRGTLQGRPTMLLNKGLLKGAAIQVALAGLGLILSWCLVDCLTNHQALLWPWQRYAGMQCAP